jgi:type I site-specific restriction endonuclease
MTPEQKARQKIDQQLDACGWIVQDYRYSRRTEDSLTTTGGDRHAEIGRSQVFHRKARSGIA